jgi:DNA recombination protein RmuC
MSGLLVVLIIILLVIVLGALLFVLTQIQGLKKPAQDESQKVLLSWLEQMKTSVDRNTDIMDKKLADQQTALSRELQAHRSSLENQTKLVSERLDNAAKMVADVQNNLGAISEFGKDIKDLSGILKSPKLRGGLGEKGLEEILKVYIPRDLYSTQYKFLDGTICDFVLFIQEGLIPIDSKFPAENFKLMYETNDDVRRESLRKEFIRDVKKHVDAISQKYIKQNENTVSQAIMYIPSESIYYEIILNSPEIEEYSRSKSIFVASPNTLVYMLKILNVAYKSYELQKNTKEVLKVLMGLKTDAVRFGDELDVLDGHINRASKSMQTARGSFSRFLGKIDRIEELSDGEVSQTPLISE